jgi:hypothetical protein
MAKFHSSIQQRLATIRTNWQTLINTICDPYRPELHYMRGPGPKWHAKHRSLVGSAAI